MERILDIAVGFAHSIPVSLENTTIGATALWLGHLIDNFDFVTERF